MGIWGRIAAAVLLATASSLFSVVASAAPGSVRAAPVPVGVGADPDVVAMPDGGALYVWIGSEGTPYHYVYSVRARRYAANGTAGPELIIADNLGPTIQPRVAADNAGNFVVTWAQSTTPGQGHRIFLRRCAAGGQPLSPITAVDPDNAAIEQLGPSIAMNGQGRFAISWSTLSGSTSGRFFALQQGPIYMRRYGSDGTPLAPTQKVSDRQSGMIEVPIDPGIAVPVGIAAAVDIRYAATPPAISIDGSGSTIVAWTAGFKVTPQLVKIGGAFVTGLGLQQVYAQRFDSAGDAAGKRALIEAGLVGWQEGYSSPAIAFTADGGYVVAYARHDLLRLAAKRRGLYLKRVDATGRVPIVAVEVMRDMPGDDAPDIAVAPNGTLAIALQQRTNALSSGANAAVRLYTADGVALSAATMFKNDVISDVHVAALTNGDFAMTWQPYDPIQAARVAGF